jgi:hypothetical protein
MEGISWGGGLFSHMTGGGVEGVDQREIISH